MKRLLFILLSLTMVFPLSASTITPERSTEVSVEDYEGETRDILTQLDELGVKVYIKDDSTFSNGYRGLYYPDKNVITLNRKYVEDEDVFLRVLRHEGWHVAQDCMSTLPTSELLNVIDHNIIPPEIKEETVQRYGNDPHTVRIEREAVWAATVPGMTNIALVACNSEYPMWEEFDPPPRTRSWLYINGHL